MKNFLNIFSLLVIVSHCTSALGETPTPVPVEEVTVNSTVSKSDVAEKAKPVTVINKETIIHKDVSSLGAALQDELGVTSTSFGEGASRPVIRGLGGDRVRVLENGTGTNDVSNTSPDHPVNVDILGADAIEILRGPAALRYGTTAVGGVVNILDNKIPNEIPDYLLSGELQLRGATNGNERALGFQATSAVSDNVAMHIETSARKTGDYRIPNGRLPFSDTRNSNIAVGTSYIDGKNFIGIAGSYMDSVYGVPNGEEDISIDMRQPKLEVRGNLERPISFLRAISLNSSVSRYKHTEFEGEETGTIFNNTGSDSRIEFHHTPIMQDLQGLIGVQVQSSRFKAIGEEAYQAPTDTEIISTYAIENYEVIKNKLSLNAGIRTDSQTTDVIEYSFPTDLSNTKQSLSRNFDTFSQSIGVDYLPRENYTLGISVAHTERAPVGQELFANGPHAATAAFEIGDPSLDPERSVGVDVVLKRNEGFVTGSIGGFSNRFSNYIGLNQTGQIMDELPIFRFESQRAQFYGIETLLSLHLLEQSESKRAENDLTLFAQQDWVWAKDIDSGEPIARIPPFRIKTGIKYQQEDLGASILILRANAQERTAIEETHTNGYTFLNASLTKDIPELGSKTLPAQLFITGENLTNEKALNHVSFIKDLAPLPGRNIMAGIRFSF